jgi:DNA-binding CsgD family transcriptional regulator
MEQRRRIYYSAAQRSSSVFSVISPTGGIRPPNRHRAKQVLSLSEREEISRWLSMRCSLRSIARHLGRSLSTISREVQRNGGAIAIPDSCSEAGLQASERNQGRRVTIQSRRSDSLRIDRTGDRTEGRGRQTPVAGRPARGQRRGSGQDAERGRLRGLDDDGRRVVAPIDRSPW